MEDNIELEVIFQARGHIEHYNGCFFEFEAECYYSPEKEVYHVPIIRFIHPVLLTSFYSPEYIREVKWDGTPMEIIKSLRQGKICGVEYYYSRFGEEEFNESFSGIFDAECDSIKKFIMDLLNRQITNQLTPTHESGPYKIYMDRIHVLDVLHLREVITVINQEFKLLSKTIYYALYCAKNHITKDYCNGLVLDALENAIEDELFKCSTLNSLDDFCHQSYTIEEWTNFISEGLFMKVEEKIKRREPLIRPVKAFNLNI